MSNLYVSLEEVERIIDEYRTSPTDIMQEIDSLPTINLSVIDDMIEEKRDKPYWDVGDISILKELKQKLLSPKK